MRKPDEVAFYSALRRHGSALGADVVAQDAGRLGMHEKRAEGLLRKWNERGWWAFGVSPWGGWFTGAAPEELRP